MSLDNRGRKKGMPKVGGAKKNSIRLHSNDVKEAVLRVFQEVNKDDTYLKTLAVEDQRLFLSLLAKLIPSSVDVEVKHKFDLGSAMAAAQARTEALANEPAPKVIGVSPEPVVAETETRQQVYQPLTIFDEVTSPDTTTDQETEPDNWPGY